MAGEISLYIHIPFCVSRCTYCDFNTYAHIERHIPGYADALIKEAALRSEMVKDRMVNTIYIGGGTPSYIDAEYILKIMECLNGCYDTGEVTEVTIEANPGTLDRRKLDTYIEAGINRLSIGLQSWQQHLLDRLGRVHTCEQYLESLKAAGDCGFENISTDLIFGIPGQTKGQWMQSLYNVIRTGVKHVSCYSLQLEEGTPLAKQVEDGSLEPVSDEADREMYHEAVNIFSSAGYRHYEISNFALPGYECRHNMVYWKCGEYLGLGAGSHSYVEGFRFSNTNKVTDYIDKIKEGQDTAAARQHIDKKESMKEFMILGLRLVDGVSLKEFDARFGNDIFEVFGSEISEALSESLIELDNDRLRLTRKGLDLANRVFLEFI